MSHDTWVHRAVTMGVAPLVRTPVRPNHLTLGRLATGIAAAILLAWGTREAQIWGAVLFAISFVLDRADGILARLQGTMSKGGHVFDLIADATSNTLIFVGLGIGLRGSWFGAWTMLGGLIAGVAVLVAFWLAQRAERRSGANPIGSLAGCDADDAMLLVPLAILFDYALELLAAAFVGAPLFAIVFVAFKWRTLWGDVPFTSAVPAPPSTGSRATRRSPPQ